mgnify:CR=1 FL=1
MVAPAWEVLTKTRKTTPQASLPLDRRRTNVAGAFAANAHRTEGRDWLLVDDVITTGSTIAAASKALSDAGARSIRVASLARAGHLI